MKTSCFLLGTPLFHCPSCFPFPLLFSPSLCSFSFLLPSMSFTPPSLSSLLGKALLYSDMPGSIYGGAAKHVTLNSSTTLQVHLSQLCGWIHWRCGVNSNKLRSLPETWYGCDSMAQTCMCALRNPDISKGNHSSSLWEQTGAGAAVVEIDENERTGRTGASEQDELRRAQQHLGYKQQRLPPGSRIQEPEEQKSCRKLSICATLRKKELHWLFFLNLFTCADTFYVCGFFPPSVSLDNKSHSDAVCGTCPHVSPPPSTALKKGARERRRACLRV